ncbi:MAG: hypothetical protein NCW75_07085 [Phycisphaera sp.]|nr:MAG: hypothetical protein NCW75_07085 [Phycisphaera sp.]
MFRPIRTDTPRGKATQTLQTGQFCVFVLAPMLAFEYGLRILQDGGWTRPASEHAADVLPAIVMIPVVALLIGVMLMYDGWWHLRRLEHSETT